MNKFKKVLLISDVPPDPYFTAGQVLNKIICTAEDIYFDFVWLNQSNLEAKNLPSNLQVLREYSYPAPSQLFVAKPTLRKLFRPLIHLLNFFKNFVVSYKVYKVANSHSSEVIWFVLQGDKPAITFLPLVHFLKQRKILHQWDPIDWWLEHRKYPLLYRKVILKISRHLEKWVDHTVVPSQTWQSLHTSQGIKSSRVDNFFTEDDVSSFNTKDEEKKPSNDFNAVFLGQFYASSELLPIIDGLRVFCNKENLHFKLHYFGSHIDSNTFEDMTIINHGHLERNDLIKEIKKYDVSILPYPKRSEFNKTSQLSFPSKLRIYLAAGLPVVSNMNLNSSPSFFLNKYYADYHINIAESSQQKLDLFIKEKATNPKHLLKRKEIAKAIVENHFSFKSEMKPFLLLLR